MSGIAGLFYRDGRFVTPHTLTTMLHTLAHRGPDAAHIWHAGPVGLAQCALWTTPESTQERQPVVYGDGQLILVADVRLDNRDDLARTLALPPAPAPLHTDADLILAAYEKWGADCPAHLVGDYAWTLWDGRIHTLLCARDHLGIRPFYYYQSPQIFAFASEAKALFCLPEIPRRLNELRIGHHLAMTIGDNTISFYQDILRLRPAHTLTITAQGEHLRRYWALDPGHQISLPSDEAYALAFRDLFTEAVRCRLRSQYPIGSLLSGGLDSSAITCVARDLLVQAGRPNLHTFSARYPATPQADEPEYIAAVGQTGHLQAHEIDQNQVSPLVDYVRIQELGDEPLTSPTIFLSWALQREGQRQGVRVMLDGLDGDTAVSHGYGYFIELARAGQWAEFATLAQAVAQHDNLPSVAALTYLYGLPVMQELAQQWRWGAFLRQAATLRRHLSVPWRLLYRQYGLKAAIPPAVLAAWQHWKGRPADVSPIPSLINPALVQRTGLAEELAHPQPLPRTAREEHYQTLIADLLPYSFELADRGGTAFGLEPRHPFSDRRLLEFCLALPATQKLSQGWVRLVLRRAMTGILPEMIQWRGGKRVNNAAITYGLTRWEGERLAQLVGQEAELLEPYVNISVLRQVYGRYLTYQRPDDEMQLWQALTLALWLRQNS